MSAIGPLAVVVPLPEGDPINPLPRREEETLQPAGTLLGHNLVSIKDKCYVDASSNDNKALFPYRGLHTLRLVQGIAVGILAAAAVAAVATGLILGGVAAIGDGILAGLITGVAIAALGTGAIFTFNQDDPTVLANERARLLKDHISDPQSRLLTDWEKADNFARDRGLTLDTARIHYLYLQGLPGFILSGKTLTTARKAMDSLDTAAQELQLIEAERETRVAPLRHAAATARAAATTRYADSSERLAASMMTAAGAGLATARPSTSTDGMRDLGHGLMTAGFMLDASRRARRNREIADVNADTAAAIRGEESAMNYNSRRAQVYASAAAPIRTLQETASTMLPALSKTLAS